MFIQVLIVWLFWFCFFHMLFHLLASAYRQGIHMEIMRHWEIWGWFLIAGDQKSLEDITFVCFFSSIGWVSWDLSYCSLTEYNISLARGGKYWIFQVMCLLVILRLVPGANAWENFYMIVATVQGIAHVLYCPPTTPTRPPSALIITSGHIARNDLPCQEQRQLHQHLRQWN